MSARLEMLKTEEEKMLYLIPKLDPTTEEYGRVLGNYNTIHWMIEADTHDAPVPVGEPVPAAAESEPATIPAEEPTPTHEEPTPAPTITKDECAEILGRLRLEKGVNVAKLIKSLGYEKLSAVPAEKYQDLIDTAKAEAGEN